MPKISALPIANSAGTGDLLVLDQQNITKRVDFNVLQSAIANAGTVQSLISQNSLGSTPTFQRITVTGASQFASGLTVSGFLSLGTNLPAGVVSTLGLSAGEKPLNVGPYLNLNVKGLKRSFGAGGDGLADDTTPITNAAASGKTIEVEEGTFNYSSGLALSANNTGFIGRGSASILSYQGVAVGYDFNSKQHCFMKDLQFRGNGATKAISSGAGGAHWAKVIGCDLRGSSTGSDSSGSVSAGNAIDFQLSFYCEFRGNDVSFWTKGLFGSNQFNGDFVIANSFRQCFRGVQISDTTANSDGSIVLSNEIESAQAGTVAGLDIQGGSNHMIHANRIEISASATKGHIYVHNGVAAAQRHGFVDNHCVGNDASVLFGDDSGSSKVVACRLEGGHYATGVTIGVDCDFCDVNINARDIESGGLTNHSVSTILSSGNDQAFTVGITGLTTSPTALWKGSVSKSIVELFTQTLNGTSNSTACTITGIPSLLRPVGANSRTVVARIQNAGAIAYGMGLLDSTGTITLFPDPAGSLFSGSATSKGWIATEVTYSIN